MNKMRPTSTDRGGSAVSGRLVVHPTAAVMIATTNGAPVNGSTLAGEAGIGSLLIRTDNGAMYRNTGTKASPTWTALS